MFDKQRIAYALRPLLLASIIVCIWCAPCQCNQYGGQPTSAPAKKCAEFNEYCINHWDCCSNSCLSFVYRCTRNYGYSPYAFFGNGYGKPITSYNSVLEQNFGPQGPAYQKQQQQQQQYRTYNYIRRLQRGELN